MPPCVLTLPFNIETTVDFNEEFSALHGHSLLEQAQFLNDAIAYILTLYRDGRQADPELPQPTSVMIIGILRQKKVWGRLQGKKYFLKS